MTIITPSQPRGYASLPAELRVGLHPSHPNFTRERLMRQTDGVAGYTGAGGGMGDLWPQGERPYPPAWKQTPLYGLRGMGAVTCKSDEDGNITCTGEADQWDVPYTDAQIAQIFGGAVPPPPSGYAGPRYVGPGATPPSPPPGYEWANVITQAGNTLLKTLVVSTPGASLQTLPNGMQIVSGAGGNVGNYGTINTPFGGGMFSSTTLAIIAVGAIAVVMLARR